MHIGVIVSKYPTPDFRSGFLQSRSNAVPLLSLDVLVTSAIEVRGARFPGRMARRVPIFHDSRSANHSDGIRLGRPSGICTSTQTCSFASCTYWVCVCQRDARDSALPMPRTPAGA